MVRLPRSSDIALTTPGGLFSARYTRSSRAGIRLPSTRITCRLGSTLAPNLRTVSPSTSTRPAPISSSQYLRLPSPAAARTFCSRTPPGTSTSESRAPPSALRLSSSPLPGRPARSRRRSAPGAATCAILFVLDVVGQERRKLGKLVQAGQAEPFEEVVGRAEQDGSGLRVRARLLDQAAQCERPHHAVAVHPAHSGHLGSAHRLPVGDDGQRLERGLGEPYFLAVAHEPLDHLRVLRPGVKAPAARDRAQLEAAPLGEVLLCQAPQLVRH